MAISDTISRVPTWGWAVGALFIVGLAFVMTRGSSSGSSYTSNAVPAADVNDILNQLQDAANQLPAASGKTTTVTNTTTIKEKSLWGADIPNVLQGFSSESAATVFKKYKIGFGSVINMNDLKRLFKKAGIKYGKSIDANDLLKLGIIKNLPTTSSTTTSTTTVQSSNNEVTP